MSPLNAVPQVRDQSTQELLRKLELDINRRLDGLLHGDHEGLVPGLGSEKGECREYSPGDDTRHIDWNVTARMQTPHVRETIADRELEARVLVDLSPSLNFGTASCEKRDLAIAAAGAVGFLTARAGNRFGATLLTGSEIVQIPARPGRPHLMATLNRVIRTRSQDGDGSVPLVRAVEQFASPIHRRGLAVVISDFLGPIDWTHAMRKIAVRHETLAVEISDPRELSLPDVGVLSVVDPETGELREVSTSNAKLRARYAEAAEQRKAEVEIALRRIGVDQLQLSTDADWLLQLARFVDRRRRHRERRAGK